MNVFYGMDIRPCIKNTITRTFSRVIGYYSISRGYNQPQTLIEMERKRMKKYKVGIIGATGMVGQRFVLLTAKHPWFEPVVLAASAHSAGKAYKDAVAGKWFMQEDIPESEGNLVVMDAEADAEKIASMVDFVFCAVNMKKDEIKALEEKYAKLECPVVSNNSAYRWTPDVPMVVPEINADHIQIIDAQRKRLGTKRGFIAVKSNCSLQSYVPALHPLMKYGVEKALVCTYQAISGAGKTFETHWALCLSDVHFLALLHHCGPVALFKADAAFPHFRMGGRLERWKNNVIRLSFDDSNYFAVHENFRSDERTSSHAAGRRRTDCRCSGRSECAQLGGRD